MSRKNYIPAYTILEVVIGLAVTAIIGSFVFFAYNGLSKHLRNNREYNEMTNHLNIFSTAFRRDIQKANYIFLEEQNVLKLMGNDNETTKYQFDDTKVLRKNLMSTDTFKVKTNGFTTNKVATNGNEYVSRVSLSVMLYGQVIATSYYKEYGVANTINQDYLGEY